jgi:hypothetical protein
VFLVEVIRSSGDDRGIAGPLVTVCLIAALAGFVTGVIAGLVQFSAPIELRIRLALVAFVLVTAAVLGSGSLAAGLAALAGSGVVLGSVWFGRRIMSALLPPSDENVSE